MRESNLDVYDPQTMVRDSPENGCDHGDFVFAFNNCNFSDRVLHIYVFPELMESTKSPSGINHLLLSLIF
ncbi:hypothetical protein Hanom_Chr16g01512601 [Helianthus anomalus]